jgi:hypothetical protein
VGLELFYIGGPLTPRPPIPAPTPLLLFPNCAEDVMERVAAEEGKENDWTLKNQNSGNRKMRSNYYMSKTNFKLTVSLTSPTSL